MKQIIALLERGFESSSGKTPEFAAFARLFKKHFAAQLATIGCKITSYTVGHFYISVFFRTSTGECYYLNTTDVRDSAYKMANDGHFKFYWRTAKDEKDYTGGHNRWIYVNGDFIQAIGDQIYMDKNKVSFLLIDEKKTIHKQPGSIGAF